MPVTGEPSQTAAAVQASGVIAIDHADQHVMELDFNHRGDDEGADLRPTLPLLLRWKSAAGRPNRRLQLTATGVTAGRRS